MLGHKTRKFRSLTEVSLEDLVPEDYFYPQIERTIDLGFVRDLAEDFYTKSGCPTIDPAVFFKLQLFTFFETVRCAVFFFQRRLLQCGIHRHDTLLCFLVDS
jgi:hypothetical protein